MKKRILFVDDEPMILQGLQRMLRSMRQEWEMEFVESGSAALLRMEEGAYDVVVSDMRMPGMSGAELLNRVMTWYPKTVRLILSGQSERELIMSCVGSTHQYLSKPCEPDALKRAITRATTFKSKAANEQIEALVSRLERLPSLPSIYLELTRILENSDVGVEEVGGLVGRDIGLTARILKIVNSGFFGLPREVATPVEAVSFLGVEIVKILCLGIHVYGELQPGAVPGFSAERLWEHSMRVGARAEQMVKVESEDKVMASQALTAGILHDAGKVMLAANLPKEYGLVLRAAEKEGLVEAEKRAFGASHADLGGYLLGLWGLPIPVVEAIAFHHDPSASAGDEFSPLTALHVANAFSQNNGRSSAWSHRLDAKYLEKVRKVDRVAAWSELLRGEMEMLAG